MPKAWAGRRVRRLVDMVLIHKGRICHLCGMAGANSADHNPPRSQLIASGVQDPDALPYLWPAHRSCNVRRRARPITDELRAELKAARLADLKLAAAESSLSPRFARQAAELSDFLSLNPGAEGSASVSIPGSPEKTEEP